MEAAVVGGAAEEVEDVEADDKFSSSLSVRNKVFKQLAIGQLLFAYYVWNFGLGAH